MRQTSWQRDRALSLSKVKSALIAKTPLEWYRAHREKLEQHGAHEALRHRARLTPEKRADALFEEEAELSWSWLRHRP